MAVRIRRDAGKLAATDDVLVWYGRAVGELQKRRLNDPLSWRYQAAIHEYRRSRDPLRRPNDRLPSQTQQRRFWSQCQHNSWFFLPWHRWYLHYFEQILIAAIAELGGPADTWALPYWNYSDANNQPNARVIPEGFRTPTLPDGSANPLFVATRDAGNDGAPVGDDVDIDLSCLLEPRYQSDPVGGAPGFGGPRTGFSHSGGGFGAAEAVPHGSMHVQVGGWMGQFHTAGLDPLFWSHHANVDRLWVVWRKRNPAHVDPIERDWLDMTFEFHDGTGSIVSRSVADVVDTTAIGFEYEDTSDPLAAPAPEALEMPGRITLAEPRIPEMVGASEGPVPLTTQPTSTTVAVSTPTGPGAEGLEAPGAEPQRIFINVENVTGVGRPVRYSVYVDGVFAGIIPLFGVEEATIPTDRHAGGGLQFRIDATRAVQQLQSEGRWDPATMKVTFVPDEKQIANQFEGLVAEGEEAPPAPAFSVGRVSVYIA